MTSIKPHASEIRVKIEQLYNAVRQLRQEHQAAKAAALMGLAARLEDLLALRRSLTAK